MAIVTAAMMTARLSEAEVIRLTDDAATGAVNTAVLAQAIAEGEGEILGYLAQRYDVPLGLTDAQTALLVQGKCVDAVAYRLCLRRPPVSEDVVSAFDRAVKWAQAIAEGKAGLVGETLVEESPAAGGRIVVEAGERVISRDNMSGL